MPSAEQRRAPDRPSLCGYHVSDLLIAAVAERERVIVLHYDSYYDIIAKVTGQLVQWVLPRGTVP